MELYDANALSYSRYLVNIVNDLLDEHVSIEGGVSMRVESWTD